MATPVRPCAICSRLISVRSLTTLANTFIAAVIITRFVAPLIATPSPRDKAFAIATMITESAAIASTPRVIELSSRSATLFKAFAIRFKAIVMPISAEAPVNPKFIPRLNFSKAVITRINSPNNTVTAPSASLKAVGLMLDNFPTEFASSATAIAILRRIVDLIFCCHETSASRTASRTPVTDSEKPPVRFSMTSVS